MCHGTPNAIPTKFSMWECDSGDTQFLQRKSGKVSRLVCYGALARFHVCVYGKYQHACIVTSRSPSKHQVCWCALQTWGNQCHLLTWIKTITPWWSCTQYSMNMHLRQSPWVHTHTTRSRALMTREDHSHSHESSSYKVHDHPHTHRRIYIYTHTYIMHNAII